MPFLMYLLHKTHKFLWNETTLLLETISSDIVFKITINLTSEKWDPTLAAGKGRSFDRLTLKIHYGVSD